MVLYVGVAGWIAGIWYASRWDSPGLVYPIGALAAVAAVLLGRADRRLVLAAVGTLALLLGAARMDRELSGDLTPLAGSREEVALRGVVLEERSRHVYLVRVQEPASGVALVRGGPGSKLRYGDLISVRGTPVEDADLESYERGIARASGAALVFRRPGIGLLDTGQAGQVGELLAKARAGLSLLVERHVPAPYAPIAEGLLVGGSLRLDREIKADFRRSGVSHILAASGYNVTMFAGLLLALLRPLLGVRRALPPVLVAIALYAGLAGFSASVVRAALMGAVAVWGIYLGRPRDSSRALAAAALLMTLWHPTAVFDIGAQLSFVATAGLIWLLPVVLRPLGPLPRPLADAVGVALTAQLATLPLGLYYFGGLSPWAPVANVIIAPLVPVGMACSALTPLGGALWYELGDALGALTGWVLQGMVGVASSIAVLPGSNLQTDRIGIAPLALYYGLLVIALWLAGRATASPVSAPSGP